jgi:hypothetical protein
VHSELAILRASPRPYRTAVELSIWQLVDSNKIVFSRWVKETNFSQQNRHDGGQHDQIRIGMEDQLHFREPGGHQNGLELRNVDVQPGIRRVLGDLHNLLQLESRRFRNHENNESILHRRRLLQNWSVGSPSRPSTTRSVAGSLSVNALSGKIMFRDVVYITHDYTIRVQDGYLIFRWWRSYVPKDVSEDLSHSDTRLSVMLNGFELHVYNRSQLYSNLERIFGIGPNIIPYYDNRTTESLTRSQSQIDNSSVRKQRPEAAMARTWRDLIPVIKIDVSSVSIRVSFLS